MSTVSEVSVGENFKFSSSTTFYILLTTTILLWMVHWWKQQSHMYKMGNLIPGPPSLPFLGNALMVLGKAPHDMLELAMKIGDNLGNIGRVWLGPYLVIYLTEPSDIEVILSSQVHLDKSTEYRFFKPWLGEGLLISSGEKWRSHRKMIAPTFHLNILKSFVGVFNKNSKNLCEKLKAEVGKTFDVHDYLSGVTVDILLETAMGIDRKTHDSTGFDYAMAVMRMCDIIHQRHYKVWLRLDWIFNLTSFAKQQVKLLNIIHGLTSRVIKSKKETFLKNKREGIIPEPVLNIEHSVAVETKPKEQIKGLRDDLDEIDENDVGEKRRLAFLDLMIESAQNGVVNLTDHEIKEEVDTIMFEGHDTTAAGSSFVLCLLGIHQNIQNRVYEELTTIFGDSDREATFQDTLEMKYLERVIMESLRMYPPVPIIARKLNQDVQVVTNNHILPKGSTIVIGTFKVHRRPDLYPNPEVFDPDNFLPEKMQKRHYYSYIPFSAGPRSCVGRKYAMLKLKVLLSTILRRYRIKSDLTEKDFKLQADIILKRTDGFRIQIEPRKLEA